MEISVGRYSRENRDKMSTDLPKKRGSIPLKSSSGLCKDLAVCYTEITNPEREPVLPENIRQNALNESSASAGGEVI